MNSKLNVRLFALALGAVASTTLISSSAFAGHHFENHSFNEGGMNTSDHGDSMKDDHSGMTMDDHGRRDLRGDGKVLTIKQTNGTIERITLRRFGDRLFEVIVIKRDGREFVKVIPLTKTNTKTLTSEIVSDKLAMNGID